MRDMARRAFPDIPPKEKEKAVEYDEIAAVKEKVAKLQTLLAIIAGNAEVFRNGFSVEWYGIATWIYDDYDNDGNKIEGTAKKKMVEMVRTLRRVTNGTAEKGADDYNFYIDIIPPNGGERLFRISTSRKSVCTKKVIGTVETEEIDYDAAPKKMVTKEVVEWVCDPILEGA